MPMDTHIPPIQPALDDETVARLLAPDRIGPHDGHGKTCVVAMSGGVDSAVTALLMRHRGYDVVGINLRLFSPEDEDHRANPCCGIPAMDDARRTCATIGVPFYAINMEIDFSREVIDTFVNEYASGRTPNPCLECNRHVKFRHLVTRARALGADCLATGHYARIDHAAPGSDAPHRLLRALDDTKDQSYVLHTMTQDQLGYLRFPLGGLHKRETRILARAFGLPVADKPESQEICFVGNRSYADFVAARRPDAAQPGEVVTSDGRRIGEHRGVLHHTIGQRRGLGIQSKEPLYVLRLEPTTNRVVVGGKDEASTRSLTAERTTFIDGRWPDAARTCDAVVRYRGAPHRCTVQPVEEGRATITFDGPGPIASPGQAVVLYSGDDVLGGGTIEHVTRGA